MIKLTARFHFTVAALLVFLAFEACSPPVKPTSKTDGDDEAPAEPAAPGKPGGDSPIAAPPVKFTAEERKKLEVFGENLATAMTNGDDKTARAAWNADALLQISLAGAEAVAPEFTRGVKRGFTKSLENRPGGLMWASFEAPWRMLRVHDVDGETRILCRIIADGGVTYIDLVPQLDAGGNVEIVDAYAYAGGEKLSETFRRLFLPQIANASKTPVERLFTTADPLVKHIDTILEFSKTIQSGDYHETLKQFRALPPELQANKAMLLIYLSAASKLMDGTESPEIENAYRDGVNRFQKHFGDDPAFLLMGIDFYFYQEDYDGAIGAIDKLDKAIGGDPYLDFFRASMLLSQEKYDEALPLAEKAQKADPDIEDAYWGVVNIQLARGEFEAVAKGLDQLIEKFEYEFDLKEDPAYDEFRLSPVGKSWIEKHAAP